MKLKQIQKCIDMLEEAKLNGKVEPINYVIESLTIEREYHLLGMRKRLKLWRKI